MITLRAETRCYSKKHQYIARIDGRDESYTFDRKFVGRKVGKNDTGSEADIDSPGLFEICNITTKGKKDQTYVVIIHVGEYLRQYDVSREEAMKIGKALGDGTDIKHVVKPNDDLTGVVIHTRKEADKARKEADEALSVSQAFDKCWEIVQSLPVPTAKKVVAALTKRLKPQPPPEPKPMLALPPAQEGTTS